MCIRDRPHDEGRSLDNPRAFKDFVVVTGREDGFTQIWVAPLTASGDQECSAPVAAQAHRMQFEADAFTARLGANAEFDPQQQLRVTYSSTVAPGSTMQYDVTSKTYEVLKVAPVPNYDARLYDTERLEVPARDGVKIPVTLFWRKDQKKPQMPTHLYGYGSYGTVWKSTERYRSDARMRSSSRRWRGTSTLSSRRSCGGNVAWSVRDLIHHAGTASRWIPPSPRLD